MPLAGIGAFFDPKNVICPSGSISPDKTLYLSADAVHVGGGGRCLPFGWSSNQRPALQSDSEPHRHSAHLSGVEMMVMTSLGR